MKYDERKWGEPWKWWVVIAVAALGVLGAILGNTETPEWLLR